MKIRRLQQAVQPAHGTGSSLSHGQAGALQLVSQVCLLQLSLGTRHVARGLLEMVQSAPSKLPLAGDFAPSPREAGRALHGLSACTFPVSHCFLGSCLLSHRLHPIFRLHVPSLGLALVRPGAACS